MRIHGPSRRIILALVVFATTIGGVGARPGAAQGPSTIGSQPPVEPFRVLAPQPMPEDADLAAHAALELSDAPPPPAVGVDLLAIQRRAEAQSRAMPGRDWAIGELAQALDYDPMAAFAFVRDSIAFDAYRGALRGARGALAARAGNAADRALLLKALLDGMVLPTRLAMGEIDEPTAELLVVRSFAGPAKPLGGAPLDVGEVATIDATVLRAKRDYARLRDALGDRVETMDGSEHAAASRDVRSHVWVQMLWGSRWLDLDPSFPDSRPGDALTRASSFAQTLPDAERQSVSVTVFAETLSSGRLEEQPVLEHHFDASAAGGQDIYLTFQPELSSLGGGVSEALGSAVMWQAALYVGPDEIDLGTPFPVRPAKIFAGTESGPVVSALRLEISIETPGADPVHSTRTLLDRVPPPLRSAAQIDPASLEPLAVRDGIVTKLGTIHHLQISTGGLNERAHATWRGIAASFVGAVMLDEARLSSYALPGALLPLTVADETLPLDSERLIRYSLDIDPDVRAFVARPRVFISSIGPASVGPGSVSETDLRIDGVRIIVTGAQRAADAARLQLWYGALEGALETQLSLERAALGDPATRRLESTSLDLGAALTVLEPNGTWALSPGTDPALADDLEGGKLVVMGTGSTEATVWWTIDPRTGVARAMLRSGIGGTNGQWTGEVDASKMWENWDKRPSPEDLYRQQDALDEAAAAARNAPKQICFGGTEESATLCVSQKAFFAYVAVGIGVTLIVGIAVAAWRR